MEIVCCSGKRRLRSELAVQFPNSASPSAEILSLVVVASLVSDVPLLVAGAFVLAEVPSYVDVAYLSLSTITSSRSIDRLY